MAAPFVLTFAAEGILSKVSSLAAHELAIAWGFKAELKKLGESLADVQDFLRGAADHNPQNDRGRAVEKWVKKLKVVAHEADNVLDEFNYEILRRKVELQNHMKKKVLNFLSASNPLFFRIKMAHKIQKINATLVALKKNAAFIHLVAKEKDITVPQGVRPDRGQTDSFFEKDEKIIGREVVVSKIIDTLLNSNKQQNLSVMAIVGMGGLGKTTLAKSVYNETSMGIRFQKKIWVCVSNSFEVDTILNQMVESLKPEKAGLKSQDALLKILNEELTGKRYALVLDDVWNEDGMKWKSLMSCLSKLNCDPGSSIIITTRSATVASISEAHPSHELGTLSPDECWSILKQRAFSLDNNDHIDAERERIGRIIAGKCGGLPLAAKVLGSMMRSKTSIDEWLSIQRSDIWKLLDGNDKIMSVLKLSFHNLKSLSVKQCFAYCAMFKKDSIIEKDNLIQLWMAQGLLHSSPDQIVQEMEDVGEQCFKTLWQNSFFQDATKDEDGIITTCKMHDLVHDLAEEVSKCENWTWDFNFEMDDQVPDNNVQKSRASPPSRVLNLYKADIQKLPNSIGKLKHLRYLNISTTRMEALPKSLSKLYNLQTLRMERTNLGKKFLEEVKNMINLRHLYFDREVEVPAGVLGQLTNLRTLSCFCVGKEGGPGIDELGGLNQLEGRLRICNLENVNDAKEAEKAKLVEKKNIRELRFEWNRRRDGDDEFVLVALLPQPMLESLSIECFMGVKFPSWIMSLNKMKKIVLLFCNNCEELSSLGHLPNLKHLEIRGMRKLKHVGVEFYGYSHVFDNAETSKMTMFGALKTLRIMWCEELVEWMEPPIMTPAQKVVVFPRLEELYLSGCPQLINSPSHFPSLKTLFVNNVRSNIPIENISSGLTSLTSLDIDDIVDLICLPEGMLKKNKNLTSLKIKRCPRLELSAMTHEMASLRELVLQYCPNVTSLPIGMSSLQKMHIFGCTGLSSLLLNYPCLRELLISGCDNITSMSITKPLSSLLELSVSKCEALSSLSGISSCTSLEDLEIDACYNLTSLSITKSMPSLRKLGIKYCWRLSSLPSVINDCTSLEVLEIHGCPRNVTSIPITQGMPYLRVVRITDCVELSTVLTGVNFFSSLEIESISITQQLTMGACHGLSNLMGIQYCTSLEKLSIYGCISLESIPVNLQVFTCLRGLEIYKCPKLKNLPTGLNCLTGLVSLKIGGLSWELDSFPDFELPQHSHIEELELYGWPKLKSLPQQIQHLTTCLRTLWIREFSELEALPEWLGNLTSLNKLFLRDCGNLKYLPTLDVMKRLTKLETLSVRRCGQLKERIIEGTGPEWHKISHMKVSVI